MAMMLATLTDDTAHVQIYYIVGSDNDQYLYRINTPYSYLHPQVSEAICRIIFKRVKRYLVVS